MFNEAFAALHSNDTRRNMPAKKDCGCGCNDCGGEGKNPLGFSEHISQGIATGLSAAIVGLIVYKLFGKK